MLVSIITAVHNRERTLGHALKSLRMQSHSAIESVVVDGGSSDRSVEVARQGAIPNSKIISEADKGIYDALNKGFRLSSGDIIGVLHSDDVFATATVIEDVVEAFRSFPVHAVYGDLQYLRKGENDRVLRNWRSGHFHRNKLRFGWMPPHPALFLRRSIIESFGGYDTDFRISGDYDAILRYFMQPGFRAHYIPKTLVRMRAGGVSNQSFDRILQKMREDYQAISKNKVGGLYTLLLKNARKVGQFL